MFARIYTTKQDSFHLLSAESVLMSNGQQNMNEITIFVFRQIAVSLMILDQLVQQMVPPPLQPLGFRANHLAEHAESS